MCVHPAGVWRGVGEQCRDVDLDVVEPRVGGQLYAVEQYHGDHHDVIEHHVGVLRYGAEGYHGV